MSAKSEPPRTGPVSILPATDGIDSDWGAEDVVPATAKVPAPARVPALANLPALANVPVHERVLEPPKEPAPKATAVTKSPVNKSPAVAPTRDESVRAASHTVSPSKAPAPSGPVGKRSGTAGYVVAVGLLATAGVWFAVRSPEPERISTPVALEAPPAASMVALPASAELVMPTVCSGRGGARQSERRSRCRNGTVFVSSRSGLERRGRDHRCEDQHHPRGLEARPQGRRVRPIAHDLGASAWRATGLRGRRQGLRAAPVDRRWNEARDSVRAQARGASALRSRDRCVVDVRDHGRLTADKTENPASQTCKAGFSRSGCLPSL